MRLSASLRLRTTATQAKLPSGSLLKISNVESALSPAGSERVFACNKMGPFRIPTSLTLGKDETSVCHLMDTPSEKTQTSAKRGSGFYDEASFLALFTNKRMSSVSSLRRNKHTTMS
jgi:hypothetical protein